MAELFHNLGKNSRAVAFYLNRLLERIDFTVERVHRDAPGKSTIQYSRGDLRVSIGIAGDPPEEKGE